MEKMTPEEVKLYFFGEGEWMQEPDQLEFEYEGYECEIRRNSIGSLCGYVKLPKEHPGYEKDYNDLDIDVHGGLTYSELENDKWVIGFDCAHSGDIAPSCEKSRKDFLRSETFKELYAGHEDLKKAYPNCTLFNETYKNIEYVKSECMSLVDQIKDMKND